MSVRIARARIDDINFQEKFHLLLHEMKRMFLDISD